jgi:hypothetical protein
MTQSIRTVDNDGTIRWKLPDETLHRDSGPAIERPDGTKEWFHYGRFHREDGPAVEYSDGAKEWYLNGDSHREDGPAVERPGALIWYRHGLIHREDGPAVEYFDGTKEWYINDVKIEELSQITPELELKYPEFCKLFPVQYIMSR